MEKILRFLERYIIPQSLYKLGQPFYHWLLSFAGAVRYGFPARRLVMIGITGTKGKTTTAQYLTSILEEGGLKVASLSSLRFRILGRERKNEYKMTMPGRFVIQEFLREAVRAGVTHVVLEVTSEGIRQFRHKNIKWHTLVFTNLAPEHIESHGGYDNYRRTKGHLFSERHETSIVNLDDKEAEYFLGFPAKKKVGYGIKSEILNLKSKIDHIVVAKDIKLAERNAEFKLNSEAMRIDLPGEFNVYNALAAGTAALEFGVPPGKIRAGLANAGHIPGRMEEIKEGQPFRVVVDYAHTPDSLREVYKTLKPASGRLIAVLGAAGGGRDKWKRPEFGKIAAEYCAEVFVTNEDPYDEDPSQILSEIKSGISNSQFPILPSEEHAEGSALRDVRASAKHGVLSNTHTILDRREAIRAALKSARPGDVVVVTGKGAESVIMGPHGARLPHDDRAVARELLLELRGGMKITTPKK
ncbi:MAG: UDP-N-acetylmuramyl-tripeptide synthetase [Candidatus Niyogibacteria bacterium]|nr:UDP-N-acetylmuramyl-tripeptide synthetase [Candidatus Niyogibacteria bacterium]